MAEIYILGELHESHYFFCVTDNLRPKVSRYSIAQCWLTLFQLGEIKAHPTTKIYVFHDGRTNEYCNASGLLLYATLQDSWKIIFDVNAFISFHGKGPWDGLIGSGSCIMSSRSSLIRYLPELQYNQCFFYRAMATLKGINAEVSKAYEMSVNFGKESGWQAATIKGIRSQRRWIFEGYTVFCYALSSSIFTETTPIHTQKLKLITPKSPVSEKPHFFHTQLLPPYTPARTFSPPPPTVSVTPKPTKPSISPLTQTSTLSKQQTIPPPSNKVNMPQFSVGMLIDVNLHNDSTGAEIWTCGSILEVREEENEYFVKFEKHHSEWVPVSDCKPCIHSRTPKIKKPVDY